MKSKEYYVGHLVKGNTLKANVFICCETFESFKDTKEIWILKIKFDKNYKYSDLKEMNVNLPYYTSNGRNNWDFKLHERSQLIPELNRLSEEGFKIEKGSMFNEFLARLI